MGQATNDLLVGTVDGETISGLGGKDLLDGGGGRDVLVGGAQNDVFRFTSREDSYRTATESFSDHIRDLDPLRESLDLTALGFTGLGDGYDNTLTLRVDAAANRTYLKSLEPDADGHRFEVVLEGVATERISLFFTRPILNDGNYSDTLIAGNVAGELLGNGGDDRIYGGLGNDILDGGTGRDRLFGSLGTDTYRFTTVQDSYRDASEAHSDRIVRFDVSNDRIDVSALGFTGLGNGHDGTLALSVNEAGTVTYLKNYDANGRGERFELTLSGDLSHTLTAEAFVFADAINAAAVVELLGVPNGHDGSVQV
ncbi:hypothetical protein [Pseudomonas entomophila]|uniref:M10 family metallopeptidase C-terminal domain-containing protein n=1 Tax=Pseudomonas sp. RIT-PI-S TaxID=3035295 RepID=UPI0021DABA88